MSAATESIEARPDWLRRAAHAVILSGGWRRRVTALLAGAVGALGMAPFNLLPATALSLVIAVWLIDGAAEASRADGRGAFGALRRAFADGWWWGFGYFLAGLWWIGEAFLVEPDKFAWALPLGVLGLPAGLALFYGAGFALARLFWAPGGWRLFALAAGLTGAEWLRGNVLTGFPWNPLGMAFGGQLLLAQGASLIGLWGLTLLAVVILASPATLADPVRRRTLRSPVALAFLALLALIGFGGLRLTQATEFVPGVRLRIMQPDLPQDAKFRAENRDAILKRYIDLSDRATSADRTGLADATHLIWPESAFPFILARDAQALAQIGAALRGRATLITGAARADERGDYYNSIQVVAPNGQILDSADKAHLVPFGEYLPFEKALRALGITQFVHIPGGFTPGPRRVALAAPGLPAIAPLICYEAIFSGEALPQNTQDRPGLLLNVSNDAWFGQSVGPLQHFAHARLRAVEEGLPMARAANSGVSAVIDPYGRVLASLGTGVADVIDAPLPRAIEAPVFTRFRHWPALALALVFVALSLAGRGLTRR